MSKKLLFQARLPLLMNLAEVIASLCPSKICVHTAASFHNLCKKWLDMQQVHTLATNLLELNQILCFELYIPCQTIIAS
jgi:hypothetical protein